MTITDVHRYSELQRFETQDLYDVLDAGIVAHVGYVRGDHAVMIPMNYARDGHSILVHGSTGAGFAKALRGGVPLSVTVTLVDGLVFEPSLYDSTVNYRSVMAFGDAEVVPPEEKEEALRLLCEHLMPGRWAETPRPTRKQLAGTEVLRLPLDRSSVKVRTGGPGCDPVEGTWTGHLPIRSVLGDPVTQPGVTEPVPASVGLTRELFETTMSVVPD
ncbi:pyridoxamine 5'-phosphate oxidase family protein [Nocardioides sp. GY 10127]|uniref:pyridoxamine 5'-phosphate oxidase family protein n=1 Tax=Nocardioides sp. GY 10127 TaxID=2569762 RepID=UPI0010A86560|nr:pyridoxamine 5'-phosphate oxidase family protein [Nocardioides sp. GY 10127]TIC80051.1 pyridoxamine 5'-phosphate oxidase family protein [Nocardioides sp. GY 10127]